MSGGLILTMSLMIILIILVMYIKYSKKRDTSITAKEIKLDDSSTITLDDLPELKERTTYRSKFRSYPYRTPNMP